MIGNLPMTTTEPLQNPVTPFVLIDEARMTENLNVMHNIIRQFGLALRANVSTHRQISIAQEQLEMGAKGISCLTLQEARQFIEAGFTNILIPSNIVGPDKTEELTNLLMMAQVTVTADHPLVVAGMADATGRYDLSARILVEVSSEQGRSGLSPAETVTLAQRIETEESLHFAGLYMYPITAKSYPRLKEALAQLDSAGIGVDVVSGGGTGFSLIAPTMPEITEIVAGRYPFYDWESIVHGWCHPDECALTVEATIVNRPSSEKAIVNAGWRILSHFHINNTFGHILEYPHAVIHELDANRAYIDTSKCNEQPVIGETIHIVPIRAEAVLDHAKTIYIRQQGQLEIYAERN